MNDYIRLKEEITKSNINYNSKALLLDGLENCVSANDFEEIEETLKILVDIAEDR